VLGESAISQIRAMLPPGWTEKYSEKRAKPCYVHEATGTTIWTRPSSSSVEQQGILTFLASPFSPVADVPEEDAGTNSKTATIKSKRKKEEEPDAPKEKKARIKYPKTPSASALVVNSDMVAVDKNLAAFLGATIYDLGGGCAVLTLLDPVVQKLLPAAVAFVSRPGVLEYDRQFTMFKSKVCTRRRGEGFFSDTNTIRAYAFSKDKIVAQALHPTLRALLDHANTFVPRDKYTAVMTNLYRSGEDGIGDHSDKDVRDNEQIGVIAFSHGASRILSFRPIDRNNGELKELHVPTENGQTLVMYGKGFQSKFTHGIKGKPTKKNADGAASVSTGATLTDNADAVRVSFTFRRHHAAAS